MVPKKQIFLLLGLLLLTGCGSSAPDSAALEYANETPRNASGKYGYTAETTAMPGEEAPEEDISNTDTEVNGIPTTMMLEAGDRKPEAEQTHYFTFVRDSSIATAEDGTELLYEYSCDTTFSSYDPGLDGWVDSVLEGIRKEYTSNSSNLLEYAEESFTSGDAESFYCYSNYQELGVARHDSKLVSLVVLSSIYSGGAHPNTVQTACNLDMELRKILRLEDVIYPDGAQSLAEMVRTQVEDKFLSLGEGALFDDFADTIAGSFALDSMTPYWYLNENGLVIFFNQYELGPYAAGIIKTEIPYECLEGILREEYFPGDYSQIPGDLLLRGDWDGYRQIPITVESDGERILVGVEGEVFQVQLSEISWLEGTAIGQKMLFSANRLTQNDVLELIGGYDDESRSFAIEFSDGQGNTTIYYIHPEGLSTEP